MGAQMRSGNKGILAFSMLFVTFMIVSEKVKAEIPGINFQDGIYYAPDASPRPCNQHVITNINPAGSVHIAFNEYPCRGDFVDLSCKGLVCTGNPPNFPGIVLTFTSDESYDLTLDHKTYHFVPLR